MRRSQYLNSIYLIITAFIITHISCADEGIIVESPRVILPEAQEIITSDLYGRVLDLDDAPIAGAQVTLRSGIDPLLTFTDEEGYFLIRSIPNKGEAAFISVQAGGRIEAFRRFSLLPDLTNYTEIKMITRDVAGSFDAMSGGQASLSSGAQVTIAPASCTDNSGNIYDGQVDVVMTWIDPTDEDLAQLMIGDLSGINFQGNLVTLRTMGMIQVELIAEDGSELNIVPELPATLRFPIPEEVRSAALPTIPLWSYDENGGVWVEEGEAFLNGNFYEGEVTHFSSWNVDFFMDPIEITGVVSFTVEENTGAEGTIGGSFLQIYVSSERIGRKGGWLCDDGSFRFFNFPKDEVFDLTILSRCDDILFQETFGPFDSDQDLGTITVNDANIPVVRIVGNAINCDGEPVTDGFISITQNERIERFPIAEDGSFEFSQINCGDSEIMLEALDLVSTQISQEQIIDSTASNIELNDLSVCMALENFIAANFDDGTVAVFTDAQAFIQIINNDIAIAIEGGNRGTDEIFSLVALVPSDYDVNPTVSLTNRDISLFTAIIEERFCFSELPLPMVSFTQFDTIPGSFVTGNYTIDAFCERSNEAVEISGEFGITIAEN